MSQPRNCHFCLKPATSNLRCSRCKNAYYCNQNCQKADWKTHKTYCMMLDEDHQTQMIKEHHRRFSFFYSFILFSFYLFSVSFKEVVARYKLDDPAKADEISQLLTGEEKHIKVEDFAAKYNMEIEDAHTFLSFIQV